MDLLTTTSDSNMTENRYHYLYIHGVFGNFYKDVLDYFSIYLYPRFEYTVIGTYSKAVEYLSKKDQYGKEVDKPNLPALILNPSGEFGLADTNTGAKQLFRFPNLAPGMINRIYEPIYQDSNMLITPGFSRFKGEIELIMLLNSFYEYCDLRVYLIQIFGGLERIIYPRFFNSYIILPEEIIDYEYTNEYTGVHYKIDWLNSGASEKLVKTTNKNELVIPCVIKPLFKMMSMSDGSEKYGGSDKLSDWKLNVSIEFEIEIPSFLVLESDYLAENLELEIKYGSCFSSNSNEDIPNDRHLTTFHRNWGLDETSNSEITDIDDSTSVVTFSGDYEFNTRYYHIISKEQAESEINIEIDLPEQIDDLKTLIVNSKYGEMKYGDHFIISDDGWLLIIKVADVDLVENQVIELYVYKLKEI